MSNSLIIITIIVVLLIIVTSTLSPKNKKKKKEEYDNDDIKIVSSATFRKKNLLNDEEIPIYNAIIKNIIIPNKGKYRVFAQVNLGEILRCTGPAFWKINTKRVDFCITANNFEPLAVIEYQGTGHKGNRHEIRDEVKKIATEKAGLIYCAINENERDQLDSIISKLLEQIE